MTAPAVYLGSGPESWAQPWGGPHLSTLLLALLSGAKNSLNINQSLTQTEPQRVSEPSPELRAQVFFRRVQTSSDWLCKSPDCVGKGSGAPHSSRNPGSPPTPLAPVGPSSTPLSSSFPCTPSDRPRLLSPSVSRQPVSAPHSPASPLPPVTPPSAASCPVQPLPRLPRARHSPLPPGRPDLLQTRSSLAGPNCAPGAEQQPWAGNEVKRCGHPRHTCPRGQPRRGRGPAVP